MNNLERAAKLIGSTVEDMNNLPEDIRSRISDEITKLDSANTGAGSQQTADTYTAVYKLWVKGNVDKCMTTVSEITGIPSVTVNSLPYSVKERLFYEYTMDHSDTETLYKTIQDYLSVSELESISALLEIPLTRLEKLPKDIQTTICGIYSMEYGEDTLVTSLREALGSWI